MRRGWAWRLFVVAAVSLIATWSWQLGLVELFEHHDDLTQQCPDDEGPCDCAANCHCCVVCAHQATPVVSPVPLQVPVAIMASIELSLLTEEAAPPSVEHPRVPKVPKHLS
jgi:hypothetical protein